MKNSHTNFLRWAWWGALGCLALAGSTGVLIRFGMLYGFPLGLQYANARHAHSHLMYFGWVTPALMALIVSRLPQVTGRPLTSWLQIRFQITIGAVFTLALLTYGAFLLYGYQAMPNGLPLSSIGAGLNVIAWYAFISLYWQATHGVKRSVQPLRLWDAALAFLVLASLGAWGIAVVSRLQLQHPFWSLALTHLFLDLFSEGWLVLAVLGLAYATQPAASAQPLARRSENLLVMGLPVVFLLAMPVNMVPVAARAVGSLGGVLVALGLVGHVIALWPAVASGWKVSLAFLSLKSIATLALTIPVVALWLESANLRISYLHWLLLGFVTLGLVTAAQATWGESIARGRRWLTVAVVVLLLTLLPLTRLWPTAWSGRWVLLAAAWAASGPVVVVIGILLAMWQQTHQFKLHGTQGGDTEMHRVVLDHAEGEDTKKIASVSPRLRR